MYFTTLFASAALVGLVKGHGKVMQLAVNGKTYKAPLIGASGDPGPFWGVSDNSPVNDPTSSDTLCGRLDKSQMPKSSAEVPAGSMLTYTWSSGYSNENGAWPHNTGPMFLYIAACNGDCNSISSSTKFYKLQEDGFQSNNVWKQADLNAGKTVSYKLPADLKAGDYVIRHEVINLASTIELFPQCQNVKITGSGSKTLSGQSASFPGAYSASDAGLKVAGTDVYAIKNNAGYKFPGPSVISLGSGSGSDSDSGSDSSSSSSESETSTASRTSTSATATATSTDANNGAGSPPGTSTDASSTATETATDTSASETATETATDTATETATETDSSSSSATVTSSDSTSTPTGTPSTPGTSCAEAWTACNAKYKGTAEDQANYTCQTDYQSCVAASMDNSTAKRMHRRRRAIFDAASH